MLDHMILSNGEILWFCPDCGAEVGTRICCCCGDEEDVIECFGEIPYRVDTDEDGNKYISSGEADIQADEGGDFICEDCFRKIVTERKLGKIK